MSTFLRVRLCGSFEDFSVDACEVIPHQEPPPQGPVPISLDWCTIAQGSKTLYEGHLPPLTGHPGRHEIWCETSSPKTPVSIVVTRGGREIQRTSLAPTVKYPVPFFGSLESSYTRGSKIGRWDGFDCYSVVVDDHTFIRVTHGHVEAQTKSPAAGFPVYSPKGKLVSF